MARSASLVEQILERPDAALQVRAIQVALFEEAANVETLRRITAH